MKILHRGAEAILYLDRLNDEEVLVKERVSKGYRIKQLDERLRIGRTRTEVNLLDKAKRAGVSVPTVIDYTNYKIFMEYLDLKTVKDVFSKKNLDEISIWVGENIAKLHESGIIHGDLTTSNMLVGDKGIFFIDFSLGKISKKVEDQATDLYLLYEALISTHHKIAEEAWKNILNTYIQTYTSPKEVVNRLEKISKRRRYKTGS